MKNTVKLFVAAAIVAVATSCGSKNESSENKDTVVTEPVTAPATTDTAATTNDTTATVGQDTTATAK